jgi:hypothetical protein
MPVNTAREIQCWYEAHAHMVFGSRMLFPIIDEADTKHELRNLISHVESRSQHGYSLDNHRTGTSYWASRGSLKIGVDETQIAGSERVHTRRCRGL